LPEAAFTVIVCCSAIVEPPSPVSVEPVIVLPVELVSPCASTVTVSFPAPVSIVRRPAS